MSPRISIARLSVFALLLSLGGAWAQSPDRGQSEVVLVSDTDYESIIASLQRERIPAVIEHMASLGSRVTGYPGCEQAASYVEQAFREIGLEVSSEEFTTLVPMPRPDEQGRPASISVAGGRSFALVPLWPNLVRMPKTPPEGLTGNLVYAGKGDLESFNGQDVADSIVLIDFNCGREWFNAPLLGAKAVLFIEPRETIRGEAEQKFLSMPVDIPRFWVPTATADSLLAILRQQGEVQVNVKCDMDWEKVKSRNILGRLEGTDPRLSGEQVVLQAYYDSISIAPTVAPGAENACSLAALLEIARALKANPPKRSVTFLATSGHFEAMAGEKAFLTKRLRGARSEKTVKRIYDLIKQARRELDDAESRVWEEKREADIEGVAPKSEDEIALERIRALKRISRAAHIVAKKLRATDKTLAKARRIDPNKGKLYERKLSQEELERRQEILEQVGTELPKIRSALQALDQAIAAARPLRRQGATTAERQQAMEAVKLAMESTSDAMSFIDDIALWISIDLSSHNNAFGVFYKGYFYNYAESSQWKYSEIGKKCREYGDIIAAELAVNRESRLVDGINAIKGKNWATYMAGKLALGNEVATIAGVPAIGFATINDSRTWVDTPMDTPERVNADNVFEQVRFLSCLLGDLLSITEPRDLYKLDLEDNFVEVKGRLVEFDPEVSTFPDEPVFGAVAVARTGQKTAMGVRCEVFDKVEGQATQKADAAALRRDPNLRQSQGRIYMSGLPNVRAKGGEVPIEGYLLDPEDGHLAMAPDMGVNGNEAYPFRLKLDQDIKPVSCVMFHCAPMTVYDMVDQRFFELLREIHVYDAATDAAPYQYGYCLPLPPQPFESSYEPVALIFAPSGTNVKITMGASVLGLRFVLVNPTRKNPEGEGYLADTHRAMYATPYLVARDMWDLDDARIKGLEKHGIKNFRVQKAHEMAREYLEKASDLLRDRIYDQFLTASRSAWSFESRAYPEVRTTANDVIKGVLFYLAMLMPFAFFAERLLIAAPDIKWQIVGFFGIFMGVFLLIALVHPAFSITFTPVIILLAFIILALTIIVISIIVQKFEDQMREIRYEQTGIRTADVGRLSASAAAFNLGISNMRRRKVRTLLTCATLVLLTFTVLSCTSVVQGVRSNRILLPKPAPYDGIMIRHKNWEPIGEPTARVMNNEFSDPRKYAVAPRAWYFATKVGDQSFVDVSKGDVTYSATAMVGMTPEEVRVTHPERALLPGGRWFEPGETLSIIIPEAMAEKLNVTPEEAASGSATVTAFGVDLRVIGIMTSRLKKVRDLDGEPITPVDYLMMQEQQQQQQQKAGDKMSEDQLREYIHLLPDSVVFVPYNFLMSQGGQLRSVGIAMTDPDLVRKASNDLISRVELNLYTGIEGRTFLCSAVSQTGLKNVQELVIPILIAALICLNTMLGSVYERVREIYIYSSLGLAPTHIAALFIAEACVYAILGAVAGYLFGQVLSKILAETGMLAGLNLNYSSLSAVGSTVIIMITVLLSVLYPARKASDIAAPGIERRWTLPEPDGDEIDMTLPFTVTGDQALGVNMFLNEYLAAHADYSLGNFSTADINLHTVQTEYGEGYEQSLMVWLAPYDLGVSERLYLRTLPTEDEEVYQIRALIVRESGDQSSWIRVTRNFINMIRKQYLLWRTFPAGLKGDYGRRALALLQEQTQTADRA
ncbi:MAG: M28 family peptidase [Armatimonadetes bacterium]|nr:M28 family peptidase [Armatimonadota bacterium]